LGAIAWALIEILFSFTEVTFSVISITFLIYGVVFYLLIGASGFREILYITPAVAIFIILSTAKILIRKIISDPQMNSEFLMALFWGILVESLFFLLMGALAGAIVVTIKGIGK
jgi:hypothetical protein